MIELHRTLRPGELFHGKPVYDHRVMVDGEWRGTWHRLGWGGYQLIEPGDDYTAIEYPSGGRVECKASGLLMTWSTTCLELMPDGAEMQRRIRQRAMERAKFKRKLQREEAQDTARGAAQELLKAAIAAERAMTLRCLSLSADELQALYKLRKAIKRATP